MSELSKKLESIRAKQIRARYSRHYEEQGNFIIEALTPTLVQIIVKPGEAAGLLGDLLKYTFGNCNIYEDNSDV